MAGLDTAHRQLSITPEDTCQYQWTLIQFIQKHRLQRVSLSMQPYIVIVHTYRRSDGLSMIPDITNALTRQSISTDGASQDPIYCPVTWTLVHIWSNLCYIYIYVYSIVISTNVPIVARMLLLNQDPTHWRISYLMLVTSSSLAVSIWSLFLTQFE